MGTRWMDCMCELAEVRCKYQGCGPVVKMTQLLLRSSFHEHGSSSGGRGLHDCGSGFCLFSHFIIFNCRGVPQIEWEMNYIK